MAFGGHRHSSSTSSSHQHSTPADLSTTAGGMYQAAQTLGSFGAPTGNLRIATSGTTAAGTDAFLPSAGNNSALSGGDFPPAPSSGGPPASATSISNSSSLPASGPNQPHPFETPRRGTLFTRQPDELHMHSATLPPGQQASHQPSPRVPQHPPATAQGFTSSGPHINLHQATPQPLAYAKPTSGGNLPGVLQPGSSGRPGAFSTNTAPATVPTMLQLQTQSQVHTTPSKSTNVNHSHSYSRSSPSGAFDSQRYVPYPGTPEVGKFATPSSAKYTPTQSQHGAISNSPLGLADIRPSGGLSDGSLSANPYLFDDESTIASNSNYLAPWAIYAFDWCKWSIHPQGGSGTRAGKIAIGSYLEDGHNYVSWTVTIHTLSCSTVSIFASLFHHPFP